jgi:hypothetical protein
MTDEIPPSINHENLPAISSAKLPANYRAAVVAIKTCAELDECKGWSDKAAALAAMPSRRPMKKWRTWRAGFVPERSAAAVNY